jgi:PHP family Zn ribbon phosphoesterase
VVGTACIACHTGDDVHDGQFGRRCEQCHGADSWKKIKSRVGALAPAEKTAFATRGVSIPGDGHE